LKARSLRFSKRRNATGPYSARLAGAIPQCGISVVGADLYEKEHLTRGHLIAIFIACSDEALADFLRLLHGAKVVYGLSLIGDQDRRGQLSSASSSISLARKKDEEVKLSISKSAMAKAPPTIGCCGHEIEGEGPWHEHLIHPLVHSLKIFALCLCGSPLSSASSSFGLAKRSLANFLTSNYWVLAALRRLDRSHSQLRFLGS
jgi:hypothetical protein